MTILNVLRQSDAVHVFSDGRSVGPPGKCLHPSSKLTPLPHLPAIVAVRGPMLLPGILSAILGSVVPSYDHLQAAIINILRAYLPQITTMLRENADPSVFDLVVAGISRDCGPDYFFVTTNPASITLAPWIVHHLGDLAALPLSDAVENDMLAVLADRSVDDLDPAADGLRLMEIQRNRWEWGSETLPGGFAQMMTLDERGIVTRLLHRWDI